MGDSRDNGCPLILRGGYPQLPQRQQQRRAPGPQGRAELPEGWGRRGLALLPRTDPLVAAQATVCPARSASLHSPQGSRPASLSSELCWSWDPGFGSLLGRRAWKVVALARHSGALGGAGTL